MTLFSKVYLHLVERNRKETISYLVHSFGFVLFILFGIRGIMALSKETTDDSHESIQFSFVVCAGAVVLQATFLFVRTVWSLENIMSKVVFASLSFEIVIVAILSYVMNFDVEYQTYLPFLRLVLPTFVVAGSMSLMMLEDRGNGLNQVEKLHTVNKKLEARTTLLEGKQRNLESELVEVKTENEKLVIKYKEMQESMKDKIKALTEQSKLMEMEKKRMGMELVVKREREELQKENDDLKKELDVSRKELEALTSTHSLLAEKLRKMEDEASIMKYDIRAQKRLYESLHDQDVETAGTLKYVNEIRQREANKIEKNCFDFRKNFDDMRKSCIAFQGDGEQAARAAEQVLAELIQSVLEIDEEGCEGVKEEVRWLLLEDFEASK